MLASFSRRHSTFIAVASLLACVTFVAGCEKNSPNAGIDDRQSEQLSAAIDYSTVLHSLETKVQQYQARVEATASQRDAVPSQDLFEAWMRHAVLTGEVESYLAARDALSTMVERQGARQPCTRQARFALATHRPKEAQEYLRACGPGQNTGVRADIAFYSGRYDEAERLASAALTETPGVENFVRMARIRMATGYPQEAAALLEAAESRYHNNGAQDLAGFKIRRGLVALHSGDFERARALYRAALRELPGWWLAEEHLAEVLALLGEEEDARLLYDKVIEEVGFAEFLEARAALRGDAGEVEEAAEDLAVARAQFRERLQLLPEATSGHVLGFYLEHGPVEQALELAEEDYRRRPYGEAAIALAEARMLSGETEAAAQLLESHLAAGWNTAEARHVLARAYSELGRPGEAAAQQAEALRLNGRIVAMAGPF